MDADERGVTDRERICARWEGPMRVGLALVAAFVMTAASVSAAPAPKKSTKPAARVSLCRCPQRRRIDDNRR
jgi:hypothetical protein